MLSPCLCSVTLAIITNRHVSQSNHKDRPLGCHVALPQQRAVNICVSASEQYRSWRFDSAPCYWAVLDVSTVNHISDTSAVTLKSVLTIKKRPRLHTQSRLSGRASGGVTLWILMIMAHRWHTLRVGKQEMRGDLDRK